jgi:molybdate transport system substrate-binding protein
MKNGLMGLILFTMLFSARAELTVFAAASTADVMNEIGEKYQAGGGASVRFNFASSGALARQIQSGAPADLFLSANQKWMDLLEEKRLIEPATRVDLLKNRLVLIAPKGREVKLSKTFSGRLAVGELRSVPAGMYAKEALEYAGLFDALRPKLVMASSVRGALMFVERGEADAGIVYATDAKISDRVEVVSVFPEESHSPILYPAAVCRASKNPEQARAFLAFLQSETAAVMFEKYGFER